LGLNGEIMNMTKNTVKRVMGVQKAPGGKTDGEKKVNKYLEDDEE